MAHSSEQGCRHWLVQTFGIAYLLPLGGCSFPSLLGPQPTSSIKVPASWAVGGSMRMELMQGWGPGRAEQVGQSVQQRPPGGL